MCYEEAAGTTTPGTAVLRKDTLAARRAGTNIVASASLVPLGRANEVRSDNEVSQTSRPNADGGGRGRTMGGIRKDYDEPDI